MVATPDGNLENDADVVDHFPTATRSAQLMPPNQKVIREDTGTCSKALDPYLDSLSCLGNSVMCDLDTEQRTNGPFGDQELRVEAPRWTQQCQAPQLHGSALLTHRSDVEDPVGGNPTRQGELFMFDIGSKTFKPWTVLLFENGIYAISRKGTCKSFAWSPFSLLMEAEGVPEGYSGWSLKILQHDIEFMFAAQGDDAETIRGQWIAAMTKALHAFTLSLLPSFALAVEPVDGRPSTSFRILAGYLLLLQPAGGIIVPYCELQAHCQAGKSGYFVMYDNQQCGRCIACIPIHERTLLQKWSGIDCSCFELEQSRFCARTPEERDLWQKAIWNVQVKCYHRAPEPTMEDLRNYRESVLDRVVQLELLEAARRIGVGHQSKSHDSSEWPSKQIIDVVGSDIREHVIKSEHAEPAPQLALSNSACHVPEEHWASPDPDALRMADSILDAISAGALQI
jgi:hypothetical protein